MEKKIHTPVGINKTDAKWLLSWGSVWNAGISQELRKRFIGISSFLQEKHMNRKKNLAFQTRPEYL
jgi:hypothetical protein